MNVSIDTYDFVVCTAIAGGFMTGEWMPFTILVVFSLLADIIGARDKK
jgi:hypothetical protein